MGLFDFVAGFGQKPFRKGADPAEVIQRKIESSNPGIPALQVAYEDGTVTLSGWAESAGARNKAVLIAGNIKRVHTIQADAMDYFRGPPRDHRGFGVELPGQKIRIPPNPKQDIPYGNGRRV